MTRTAMLKFAASGLIAAISFGLPTTTVAAGDGDAPRANPARASSDANRATRMLERGRMDRAVGYAENAVLMDPDNAAHRALLGQTYLANGRFASAESSFAAARALGDTGTRTIVGHVLSMIALGRSGEALATIDAHAATLPASDLGLALTLAGQPERGVMVLTDVVRSGDSTARDRQNLALSYAAAGRWLEARLIAAQDLGAAGVGPRIEQWASMLQAGDPRTRIASLLGTSVAQDPGMPVRLALGGAPVTVAAAAVDPAPIALYAPPPPSESDALVETMLADAAGNDAPAVAERPVEVAIPASAPVVAPVAVAAVADANAPLVFVSNPVIQPLRSIVAAVAPLREPIAAAPAARSRPARVAGSFTRAAASTATAPAGTPSAPAATAPSAPVEAAAVTPPTGPVRTSGWAVQLGAFDNAAIARSNWSRLSQRHAALAGFDGVATMVNVGGRTFHRLNATGFDSREEANALCAQIRRAGGTCFVRSLPATERAQWASRPLPTRVATR